MSTPANPFSFWVSPSETADFKFVPLSSARPAYIRVDDDQHILMSVVLWAEGMRDTRRILHEANGFRLSCDEKYRLATTHDQHGRDVMNSTHEARARRWRKIIELVDADNYQFEHVVSYLPMKVGWACNDTI